MWNPARLAVRCIACLGLRALIARLVSTCIPIQHPERAQRDPTIRRADRAGQFLVDGILVSHVEQPAPVELEALAHDLDGLLYSRIGRHAGRAQVIERAEHVVVPERRKRELRPGLIRLAVFDHLAGRQPSE